MSFLNKKGPDTKKFFEMEEDEENIVVTFMGQAAMAFNMLLDWNLQKPVFRKVYKKGKDGAPATKGHCDFTQQFQRQLKGDGLPTQEELNWNKKKKLK